MNQILRYTCPKCGNKQYEIGEIWAIGSLWARIFEYYSKKFTYISCQKCRYTELFKVPQKDIGEVFNNLAR
jgi:predicted nucleic-acid-binding Zn-ribbon protein